MQTAIVIVLRDGSRMLAIRRAAGIARAGYWTPPTGRLESDETQATAVEREAFEELGLKVQAQRMVWECETDDGGWRLHWWLATIVGGALAPDAREVGEVRWVTPAEFLALEPIFDRHREFFLRIWPNLQPDPKRLV